MFIDESGNHLTDNLDYPPNRYLCLFGLIFADADERALNQEIKSLKVEHFGSDSVVLHRDDIQKANPPFEALRDPVNRMWFDLALLTLASKLNYTAICAIIDKRKHISQYRKWHKEPYHYCLEVLLERYVNHLDENDGRGDIVIEARSKTLDRQPEKLLPNLISSRHQCGYENLHARYSNSETHDQPRD
jgi:hypothetical protein